MPYDSAKDQFPGGASVSSQGTTAKVVTPSDSTDLNPYAKALYIGVSGNVAVVPLNSPDDTPVTFLGHPTGYLRLRVRRVFSTGTTASNILALSD